MLKNRYETEKKRVIDWYNNNGPYSLVMYWLQPGYKIWQIIPKANFLFSK